MKGILIDAKRSTKHKQKLIACNNTIPLHVLQLNLASPAVAISPVQTNCFEFSVPLTILIVGHYKVYCFLKRALDNSIIDYSLQGVSDSFTCRYVWKSIARKETGRHKELGEDLPGYRTCMTYNIELLLRKVANTQSQFICSTVTSPVLPLDINVHELLMLRRNGSTAGRKNCSGWL